MEGELQVAVGRNIRRARTALGLSQEQFGERVGWHRTFVGGVERGERNLTFRTLERVSEHLQVEPIDLLWDREQIAISIDGSGAVRFTRHGARPKLAAADGTSDRKTSTGRSRRSRPTS